MSYERIKHIPLRFTVIVTGYIREYEALKNSPSIPESVQLIVLLFYFNPLNSSILTDVECGKLLSLFDSKGKFKDLGTYSYNLIYRSSINGGKEKDFKDRVHGKGNVLCLLHTEEDNVFGGYTSCGWDITDEYCTTHRDDKAFLFSIRSIKGYEPAIFDVVNAFDALRNQKEFVCMFGNDCTLYIDPREFMDDKFLEISFDNGGEYEKVPDDMMVIEDDYVKATEIEVFQLK